MSSPQYSPVPKMKNSRYITRQNNRSKQNQNKLNAYNLANNMDEDPDGSDPPL